MQNISERKSPVELKKHMKELIKIYYPRDGYVFNTIHNIFLEVLLQNKMAMFEVIEEFYEDL